MSGVSGPTVASGVGLVVGKGGDNGELWMTTQWWGILGLIGWAYLLNALVYLYAKGNLWIMALLWIVLNGLAVLTHSAFAPKLDGLLVYLPISESGSVIKDHSLNQFDGKSLKIGDYDIPVGKKYRQEIIRRLNWI